MAQRKVTTVLQMLADKKAAAEAAAAQAVQEQYAQHTPSAAQPRTHSTQPEPAQPHQEPVSFAQLAAAQAMPVTMQQNQQVQQQAPAPTPQHQPAQPTQHYDAHAVNPYLDPDIEMPEPEPFDISSLDYAESAPVNPLSGAIHVSGVADNVYDQVYL